MEKFQLPEGREEGTRTKKLNQSRALPDMNYGKTKSIDRNLTLQ